MKWFLVCLTFYAASAATMDWEILPKCNGKDWEYFADPGSNCEAYFRCENGRPVRHYCDQGLLFDVNTKSCNWAPQVNCPPAIHIPGGQGPNQPQLPPLMPQEQPHHPPHSVGYCPPHEDPQVPTHLADPMDCTKFYKCLNGRPIPQNCPNGLHWDDTKKICDYPGAVQCWKRMKALRM
ncbi:hypothetical protein DMENIID0001_056440 [Sergentomyia squamirostris]